MFHQAPHKRCQFLLLLFSLIRTCQLTRKLLHPLPCIRHSSVLKPFTIPHARAHSHRRSDCNHSINWTSYVDAPTANDALEAPVSVAIFLFSNSTCSKVATFLFRLITTALNLQQVVFVPFSCRFSDVCFFIALCDDVLNVIVYLHLFIVKFNICSMSCRPVIN